MLRINKWAELGLKQIIKIKNRNIHFRLYPCQHIMIRTIFANNNIFVQRS